VLKIILNMFFLVLGLSVAIILFLFLTVTFCLLYINIIYYYAAFNAPCVGHKADESQA